MPTRKVEVTDLHKEIEVVCPIEGISLKGDVVRIDFKAAATPSDRQQAQAIADAWDWNADVERELTLEERVAALEAQVATLLQRG